MKKIVLFILLLMPSFATAAGVCGYADDYPGSWVEGEKSLIFVPISADPGHGYTTYKAVLLDKNCHEKRLTIGEEKTINCGSFSVGDGAKTMTCTIEAPRKSTQILSYRHGKIDLIESDSNAQTH